MRTRLALVPALVLLAVTTVLPHLGRADAPPANPPASFAGDRTVVRGDVPENELIGRWLVVFRATPDTEVKVDAPTVLQGESAIQSASQTGKGVIPVYRTFEIRRDGERLAMNLHRREIPGDLKDPAVAQADAKQVPVPDAELRAKVDQRWAELQAAPGEQTTVESQLLDFQSMSEEEKAKFGVPGMKMLIVTNESYKGGTSLVRNTTSYVVTELTPERMSGKALQAMVLPARNQGDFQIPPLPVGLQGEFVAVRVDDAGGETQSGGFLSRLFSGCSSR
jgi:hypothetical protein